MILTAANDAVAQDATADNGNRRNRAQRAQRAQRDPAQMQTQRVNRYRELLEIKNDDEWKLLQPRIEKVLREQSEARVRPDLGRNRRSTSTDAAGTPATTNTTGRARLSNQDAEALKTASTSKLSKDEMTKRLQMFRAAQKAKEDALAKDQEELRKLLTVRQEAIAVLNGLLK
jgi:5-methylcytosine-specific restriction endonuclease McrBC regulatory subunit McrC